MANSLRPARSHAIVCFSDEDFKNIPQYEIVPVSWIDVNTKSVTWSNKLAVIEHLRILVEQSKQPPRNDVKKYQVKYCGKTSKTV